MSPSLEDTNTLSSSLRRETTAPSCPLCLKLMVRRQNRVNKGNFWSCQQWPKCNGVFSLIFAAAQHLDSSCTDCWNRAVRFGRPDLLEVSANSDSPLAEALESADGEGLRASFRNGYDLTTKRGRDRLCQFCSTQRPRHVWFSIITTCIPNSGWNCSRGSEIASTRLSR